MLQLSQAIRSILFTLFSVGLFLLAYISLGWGSALANTYSLVVVPFGAAAYTLSIVIAARSKKKWLITVIASLGTILGALVLLVSVEAFIDAAPHRRWVPALVVLVLAVNCLGLALFFKAQPKEPLA
jgi:hypothetical protein